MWQYARAADQTDGLHWKVWFDGEQRIIQLMDGFTSLNVQKDVYSAWKQWMVIRDFSKWPPALRTVGGDPISATEALGDTYFLTNGWRIRPYVGDYQLDIDGNLYVDGGTGSVITLPSDSNILTNLKVSSLVSRQIITEERIVEVVNQSVLDLLNSIETRTIGIDATTRDTNVVVHGIDAKVDNLDSTNSFTNSTLIDVQNTINDVETKQLELEIELLQAKLEAKRARQMQTNKAVVSSDLRTVTVYDDDGVTPMMVFNVSSDQLIRTPNPLSSVDPNG
jgi:hypothetical protein